MRRKLALDAEAKQIEFDHFREENLWRLNAMSERTLEMAALEEDEVDAFLAQDEKKWHERVEALKRSLERELLDGPFLDGLAEELFARLLPPHGERP